MAELLSIDGLLALATLLVLEIVLNIDNVIFIAIITSRLPKERQARTRAMGISLAVVTRLLLLVSITWVMRLTEPLVAIMGHDFTGRDLILLFGGLFLIGKSTNEIHQKLASVEHEGEVKIAAGLGFVLVQIVLVDIILSLDSVITDVAFSGNLWVIIPAVVTAAGFMLIFSGSIADFVERHQSVKILALTFLILIGSLVVVEALSSSTAHDYHLKNYVYFAMAVSVLIELLNIQLRKRQEAARLRSQQSQPIFPESVREIANDIY